MVCRYLIACRVLFEQNTPKPLGGLTLTFDDYINPEYEDDSPVIVLPDDEPDDIPVPVPVPEDDGDVSFGISFGRVSTPSRPRAEAAQDEVEDEEYDEDLDEDEEYDEDSDEDEDEDEDYDEDFDDDEDDDDEEYDEDFDDGDDDFELEFGRVNAARPEKEFVYLPFLDIEELSEADYDRRYNADAVRLEFGRVNAARPEKEFVYIPDYSEEEDYEDLSVIAEEDDSDIILIPMEFIDDPMYKGTRRKDSSDDSGISVVGGEEASADLTMRKSNEGKPVYQPVERRKKKNAAQQQSSAMTQRMSRQQPPAGMPRLRQPYRNQRPMGGMRQSDIYIGNRHEMQFIRAMRSIDPDVLAAVRQDPVQLAALEQAVRIALVQQAAQDAVARATGTVSLSASQIQQLLLSQRIGTPEGDRRAPQQPPRQQRSGSARGTRQQRSMSNKRNTPPVSPIVEAPAAQTKSAAPPVRSFVSQFLSAAPVAPAQDDLAPIELPGTDTQPFATVPPISQAPSVTPPVTPAAPSPIAQPSTDTPESPNASNVTLFSSPAAIRAARALAEKPSSVSSGTSPATTNAQQSAASAQTIKDITSNSRSGCLVWVVIVFVAVFIGIILWAIVPSITTESRYQSALTYISDGNYSAAATLLDDLGEYKDSQTKLYECYYSMGTAAESVGDYVSAIEYFTEILGYSDSQTHLEGCKYAYAQSLMREGKYDEAYDTIYSIATGDNDAGKLAKEANNMYAEQLRQTAGQYMQSGDYVEAYEHYRDAYNRYDLIDDASYTAEELAAVTELRSQTKYLCAGACFSIADASESKKLNYYKEAAELYLSLGDYSDSRMNYGYAQYKYITAHGSRKDYTVTEVLDGLDAMCDYLAVTADQKILDAVHDPIYHDIKLLGRWTSAEYDFTIFTTESGEFAVTGLIPGGYTAEDALLSFEDNTVTATEISTDLMYIVSFTPAESAVPTSVSVIAAVNEQAVTLTRTA